MLLSAGRASAIEPTWDIDFESVFDNREGDHDVADTKTWLFTRLAPEVGLRFSEHDRIAGGAVWYQPIGSEWDGYRISPTLYYRHEDTRWRFSMGMFPRSQLVEEMPGYLWSDSLRYCQKNLRGVLAQYVSPRGFAELYLDWRGMQTRRHREAFNVVFHGQMSPRSNWFNFGGYIQMNHYAKQKDAPEQQRIIDNFIINPYIGVDLGRKARIDSLTVRAGMLMTIERNRDISDGAWNTPAGLYIEAVGEYKRFGARNTLYIGRPLMPSYQYPDPHFADDSAPHSTPEEIAANPVVYDIMGPGLYQGEPFYQKKFYDRLDIYADIIRTRYVNLRASLDFNFYTSGFIFYQKLSLRVYLP